MGDFRCVDDPKNMHEVRFNGSEAAPVRKALLASRLRRRVSEQRAFVAKGDAVPGNRRWPGGHRQLPEPSECVSRSQYALNASVHFFFLNEFTSGDLIDTYLHLLTKFLIAGEQLGNGLLH